MNRFLFPTLLRTLLRAAPVLGLCLGFSLPAQALPTFHPNPMATTGPSQGMQRSWESNRQVLVPSVRRNAFSAAQPVEITEVRAQVKIVGSVARTTLEIDLFNPGNRQAEAELLLPVPSDAAISGFLFEGPASGATAELLPADSARELYDSIVARLRDPALLEFAGRAALRSSVFPVPASGTQKVRLVYDELLKDQGGRFDYELPRTASLDAQVPWRFQIEVLTPTSAPTIYSPSHKLTRTSQTKDSISLTVQQANCDQPGSFLMSILPVQNGLSASVLACPDSEAPGGTWLLVASLATASADALPIPREVTLVLDRSGSMSGEKFEQAREAARQVLEGLRPGELFRLLDYSNEVASLSSEPIPKNDATMKSAREYLKGLTAGGGTNIEAALAEALRPATQYGALGLVLFLTDGIPSVGDTTESGLSKTASSANRYGHRIFPFGVGNDVNSPLLDSLALTTRGKSTYVRPEQSVEVAVADVFLRLKGPRLMDLEIDTLDAEGNIDTTTVRDLLPQQLPDLFEGDQLALLGRHTKAHAVTFRIRGRSASGPKSFLVKADLGAAKARNDFVPRLWATRRIALLMDSIRQMTGDGVDAASASLDPRTKELADEILVLSVKYGVLSEYTAFLALEGTDLGSWNDLASRTRENLVVLNSENRWGAAALNNASNFQEEYGANEVDARQTYYNASGERVAIGNNRQVAGGLALQQGTAWVDGELLRSNKQAELPAADVEIHLGSEQHRQLIDELVQDRRNGLAALPGEVLLQHRGQVIRLRNDAVTSPVDSATTEAANSEVHQHN